MKKRKIIRYILILLITYGAIFTLVTVIPIVSAKKVSIDSNYSNFHMWSSKTFKVDLIKNQDYSIIVSTSNFWFTNINLYLFNSPFQIRAIKFDSVGINLLFNFVAEKSGTHFIRVVGEGNGGFFDLLISSYTYSNDGTQTEKIAIGKIIGYVIPFVIISFFTLALGIVIPKITKNVNSSYRSLKTSVSDSSRKIDATASKIIKSFQSTFNKHSPATYAKPSKAREEELRQIFKRYKSISLEEMAKLLVFDDIITLQNWLIELPESIKFVIDRGYVIIPDELREESEQSQQIINSLARSLDNLKHYSCYYCGYPLEKESTVCSGCDKTITRCSVCKLPLSFGDEIGQCCLCEGKGHLNHLHEWVKINGKCPLCMQNLPVEGIILLSNSEEKKI